MKIEINYDLLNKVIESKKGFSLSQISKYIGKYTFVSSAIDAGLSCIIQEPTEKFFFDIIFYLMFHVLFSHP